MTDPAERDARRVCAGGHYCRERQALRERLYVALVEQRVIDSQKYGEAAYAPITWADVDAFIPPSETAGGPE